jgi:hypothetical protein
MADRIMTLLLSKTHFLKSFIYRYNLHWIVQMFEKIVARTLSNVYSLQCVLQLRMHSFDSPAGSCVVDPVRVPLLTRYRYGIVDAS